MCTAFEVTQIQVHQKNFFVIPPYEYYQLLCFKLDRNKGFQEIVGVTYFGIIQCFFV